MADDNDTPPEDVDPRIRCSDCAAVCCRLTVAVMPDDRVPDWLIAHDSHGMEILARDEHGWCLALDADTARCTIYDDRPGSCRSYAMGGPGCRQERARWRRAAAIGTPVVVIG